MSHRRIVVALAVLVASIFALGPVVDEASGQYFGRNKVQYKDFDFSVLETDHFDIYFYESEREAAILAGRMAERWYSRLSRVLDRDLRGRQPIVFYASHPDFEQTNAIPGQIGESTGGATEFLKRRIVLPMAGSLAETDHVLGHELVHAFQFDITGQGPNSVGLDAPVAAQLPLWFIEGMAEYLSIGSVDPFTTQWLRGALRADELPDFGELGQQRYFPYRYGHALWAYVGGRFGDDAVGRVLKISRQSGDARLALARVLGLPTDTLAAHWHSAIEATSGPVLEATLPADSLARRVVGSDDSEDINMGPALSPDGREMIFLSQRDVFAMDLYLADTETGEVKNKITDTALDPHFESLQYLASSGAWSPDGERFAVAAVVRGRPVLSIFDPHEGDKLREIRIPEVGEIFNPTWSPDGRQIVFSAQVGGFTDLFVVDLESGERTRLTDDVFAELHPAWSPDGERVAFVTDRFTSDLESLQFGDYRLALLDWESKEIREVPGFESGKHINPNWTPDSEGLYFLAEPEGITNLYRVDLSTGQLAQVTSLQTGVSGITALSPALSVAREAGNAVFSVHGEGNFVFDLYAIDSVEQLAGEPVSSRPDRLAVLEPGQLPPPERSTRRVDELLADAELGLADPLTFEFSDYDPSLGLDFVGRPNLAVGENQFGFFVGGGGSMFFSDMLGNRNLATQLQVQGGQGSIFNSTSVFAGYTNEKDRLNWGVLGGQSPLISRFFELTPADDGTFFQFDEIWFWQINREVTGVIDYPFNRSQRVEFSAGVRNVDFASEVRRTRLTPSGQVIDQTDMVFEQLDTIPSINAARASAALVYDNTIFGSTAPMAGQRYRLEVAPTAGTLNYYTVLGDYRRYFMPLRPFTLAGRALHYGRYGGGAEDFRLQQFFIGYPSLVRGYDAGTFRFQECEAAAIAGSCPVFDQLIGSRLAVFNAEARLPFLGGIGLIPAANIPPVDLLAFFDAGVAWTKEQEPGFLGGERDLVRSVGVGARLNLFGLLLLELDYVNPLDREQQGWYWDLSMTPGF